MQMLRDLGEVKAELSAVKAELGSALDEMVREKSEALLARQDIEKFMGTKVYLETWVKVKENWRDNVNFIRSQGYNEQ